MSLQNQIYIHSVDTSAFYHQDSEVPIHKKLNKLYLLRGRIKHKINKVEKEIQKTNKELKKNNLEITEELKEENKLKIKEVKSYLKRVNYLIRLNKDRLYKQFSNNAGRLRILNEECVTKNSIVSVFESILTRTMGIKTNELCNDIFIIQVYYFDILKDIMFDGFEYKGERYRFFTASAGQIRTKKIVFIKEKAYDKFYNSISCGLSIDKINEKGGVNVNKYLAYLALVNSATDEWEEFDIDKSIVVEDFETEVWGEVDYIDDKTYEIERREMNVPIPHTDGCGMTLSKKNKMVRLPWVKGLLISFPYDKFIREHRRKGIDCGKVKDIYGIEHDILEEDIQFIFTKSQFKMWKYYNSWEDYKDNYKKYGCMAGQCNEEEDRFNYAKLNYQMLQTLTDISFQELESLANKTRESVYKIGNDRETMLKVLGVLDGNFNKNYLQQGLEIYPELLNDTYSKEILKEVKKSMVKSGRAGKLSINGMYTFISPDLYAFCEYLFLNIKHPKGLLDDGEVFCHLYKKKAKLDCLRSPHLYREHAVRNNVVDKEKRRWFKTNALYTSTHDLISKYLMFDVDGDKSLVWADELGVEIAERNMKGIVPLYYNMHKAKAVELNSSNIYNGLITAYTGGNIGEISNNITKVWNSDKIDLDVIKLLCLQNNEVIDYAKTLYKSEVPKSKEKLLSEYTKMKTPHFFIYAKEKELYQVEGKNDSVVNMLERIIPNPRLNFKATNLGQFDYRMLMRNKNIIIDHIGEEIIEKYKELDLRSHFLINRDDLGSKGTLYAYFDIRNTILQLIEGHDEYDIDYVVDVLVKYLYKYKKSNKKVTLWESFGHIIVENLKRNVQQDKIMCERCGARVLNVNGKVKYCSSCAKIVNKEKTAKRRKSSEN